MAEYICPCCGCESIYFEEDFDIYAKVSYRAYCLGCFATTRGFGTIEQATSAAAKMFVAKYTAQEIAEAEKWLCEICAETGGFGCATCKASHYCGVLIPYSGMTRPPSQITALMEAYRAAQKEAADEN